MSVKLTDDTSVPKASARLALAVAAGLILGLLAGWLLSWAVAPLIAWDTATIAYLVSLWPHILKYDGAVVRKHALREDPSRAVSDIVLVFASVASLGAVGLLLVATKDATGLTQLGTTSLAVLSVIASWFIVHTVFALKYAELYYGKPEGGVDFGESTPPTYVDFAYLAATLGMTFQVSDTVLKNRQFRSIALKHALLAYLLGTVIIATTVNLIASLGK
ncbi:MAG: DUF1345 domain-containing protein [Candidatus Saccharimonadales bacterium]